MNDRASAPMADMTAIVLAGGESRRFGSNKALAPWPETATVIQRVTATLSEMFPRMLVIVRWKKDWEFLERPGIRLVEDLVPGAHAMGGIYTGLSLMETEFAFACACDMPLLHPALVRTLCGMRGAWPVVPRWEGILQPLCAVYSKDCLPGLKEMIDRRDYSLKRFFETGPVRIMPEPSVKTADPCGNSFADIDTPEDYDGALLRQASENQVIPAKKF